MEREKKYQDYKKENEKLQEKLKIEEDECAKKQIPFDEMVEQTKEIRLKILKNQQEMRLLQEPTMVFDKKWKGEYYTLEEFIRTCELGGFNDEDGYGYYATELGKSDILIYPSDVLDDKVRKDFSHVIWFDRN